MPVATPVEGALALAPVTDWLHADAFRPRLLGLDEVWLTEVARLLSGLLVECSELPHPSLLTESGQQLRLFEALPQVVRLVAFPVAGLVRCRAG